jgi:hypothetical protein
VAEQQNPGAKTGLLMGRILIGLGMAAIAFAVWAFLFGQSVKPLGEVGDGLPLWSLIGICAGVIGIADTAIGAFIIRQARRALAAAGPGR